MESGGAMFNTLALLFLLSSWGILTLQGASDIVLEVKIDLETPISMTGPKYIGVTMDSFFILNGNFTNVDLNSPKLAILTRALSPSYLRVGGTKADALMFNRWGTGISNNTIGPDVWDKVYNFTQLAGWDLIFDVNSLTRSGGHWDNQNAGELLLYSAQRVFNISWFQLGNEPNLFPMMYNTTVSPQSLAQDYQQFDIFLKEFPAYRNAYLLGPEVTNLNRGNSALEYLTEFFKAGGGNSLSAVGVHHYYCPYYPITVDFFVNATALDTLKTELEVVTSLCRQYVPQLPVWLSETSSVYPGCPGETNFRQKYADGFMWLDKLGLSAQYGIQHVNRQQFFSQLILSDYTPLPDYYLTVLYKRLVEGPVLRVLGSVPTVRVYAHCSNPLNYPQGSVTLYALNVESINVTLHFSQFSDLDLDVYMLTPGDSEGLTSGYVALNGQKLVMDGNNLPPLLPKTTRGSAVTFASRTFGFVVLRDANVQACM